MEKELSKKASECTEHFLKFSNACTDIILQEKRTIKNMRECKMAALETINALTRFVAALEKNSTYIDFPVGWDE